MLQTYGSLKDRHKVVLGIEGKWQGFTKHLKIVTRTHLGQVSLRRQQRLTAQSVLDPEHFGFVGICMAKRLHRDSQRLSVSRKVHRHPRVHRSQRGDDVHPSGLLIHGANDSLMNEVRQADPRSIAITVWMQRTDINAAHRVGAGSEKAAVDLASNYIGIQSRSAK